MTYFLHTFWPLTPILTVDPHSHPVFVIVYLSSRHPLFTLSWPSFYPMLTLCLPFLYPMFTLCLPTDYPLFTLWLPYIYPLFTLCLPFVYPHFTLYLHPLFTLFTLSSPSSPFLHPLSLFLICSLYTKSCDYVVRGTFCILLFRCW